MKRRNFLSVISKGLAAGVANHAVASASQVTQAHSNKPTFVLVHGTWHGGWVWKDVRSRLRAEGFRVFTPTCTGCGERAHLSSSEVGLETHIQDVVNVIEFEELDNVILVGHSFSGLTITGVADRVKNRIRRIVFFDAFVPREGVMSIVKANEKTGEFPPSWLEAKERFVDGHKMVFWDKYPITMLINDEDIAQHGDRLKRLITTHPANTWTDTLELKNGGWHDLSPVYIHCVGQRYSKSSEWMIGPARTSDDWQFIELNTPRLGMATHPELVTSTMISLI